MSAKAALDAAAKVERGQVAGAEDDEDWVPNASHRKGNWLSGRAGLSKQFMPMRASLRHMLHERFGKEPPTNFEALRAVLAKRVTEKPQPLAGGTTSLAGQVLRLNGRPLANVTVQMGSVTARTDGQGEFLLANIPAGLQRLTVNGESANRPNARYGRFTFLTEIVTGQTNDLNHIVWMPRLDMRNAVDIPSPTTRETVITHPHLPGLELVLPAGAVIRDANGRIVTQVSITPIPVDQTPFPMPYTDVPIYFTVQPGGAVIQGIDGKPKAALMRYPNYSAFGPGHLARLFDYDPNGRGWYVYDMGRVSADGQRIDSGRDFLIYQFTANSASSGGVGSGSPPVPQQCPKPNKTPGGVSNPPNAAGGGDTNSCGGSAGEDVGGDPVNLFVGHYENTETDMVVQDIVPIALTRTYRTLDKAAGLDIVRPFGIGSTHPYETFLEVEAGGPAALVLVQPDSTRIRFVNVNPAGGLNNDYINTDTPGKFHQGVIHYHNDPVSGTSSFTLYFRDGRRWGFSVYNARLLWTEDRNGNRVTLTRNGSSGYVSQILGPTGRYINLAYNGSGQVSQATDHTGRTVIYGYDAGQRLTSVTDPNGGIRTYTWDTTNNRITAVKDQKTTTLITNTYDGNGRVATQTLADSSTYSFIYTLTSGVVTKTEVTDRRGKVRRAEFNSAGRIFKDTFPLGIVGQEQVTTFVLDATTGRRTSMTDARLRRTDYQYDALGNLTQIKRLAQSATPVITNMTYGTAFSNLLTLTDPNNKVTTFTYDAKGNLTEVKDALLHTNKMTYDAQGRVVSVKDGLEVTVATLAYSGADLTSVTDALARTTTFNSDAAGRLSGIRDPMGRVTTRTYDLLDRLTKITDALGGMVQFTYDANSNLLTHVDQKNQTTTYTYDTMNRAATRKDALLRTETYAYETGGKLNKVTDRKSQVSGMTFDSLGRVTQRGFGATIALPTTYTSTIGYTWDKGNRLTQLVDSVGGTITRTYDGLDRVLTEVTTQGTVTYTYDAGGRRLTMTVTGQPTITYTWDDANRLTQIQQAAGASNNNVVQTIGFIYDNADRRTKTTLANGSNINYAYNNASEVTSITYRKADTSVIGDLVYTYDAAGRRIKTSGSLAEANLPATTASTVYNANNQLTSFAGVARTYDNNGNMTGDGSLTYTWNARNQLTGLSGAVTASFSYDAMGRRIGKTVGATTTGYVYDGMNFVQEKNGTGGAATVAANLITGLGLDETFERMTGSNPSAVLSHFLPEANNNTIRLLNGAQAVTDTYTYEPYGKTTQTGTNGNTQQYTGRENDGTGLYFYRTRYYHPTISRFISEDPIEFAAGPNIYSYVEGNPINWTDPLGLEQYGSRPLSLLTPSTIAGLGNYTMAQAQGSGALVRGLILPGLITATAPPAIAIAALVCVPATPYFNAGKTLWRIGQIAKGLGDDSGMPPTTPVQNPPPIVRPAGSAGNPKTLFP